MVHGQEAKGKSKTGPNRQYQEYTANNQKGLANLEIQTNKNKVNISLRSKFKANDKLRMSGRWGLRVCPSDVAGRK